MPTPKRSPATSIVDREAKTLTCPICGERTTWPLSGEAARAWTLRHQHCYEKHPRGAK